MRYSLIDLFRVLAILLVVFFHLSSEIFLPLTKDFINIENIYRFNTGSLGVFLFILVSGLSLSLKYKNQEIDYKKFITKRFIRIYPAYFIALAIGIIIYFTISKEILKLGYYYRPGVDFSDVVCSFTGFCHFLGRVGGPFIAAGWFLGIIIPFYFLFPFLLKKFKANPPVWLFIVFLVSFLYRAIEAYSPFLLSIFFGFWPLHYLFEFGLGIYLALKTKENFWGSLNKFSRFSRFISWAGLLSFPVFLVHHPFLFIINYFNHKEISHFISLPLYLITVLFFSQIVLFLSRKITKKGELS